MQTWRIFFSFFPSPNRLASTEMRIKSGSNVSDLVASRCLIPRVEDYPGETRTDPRRLANKTRHASTADPRESNSGLESDIYYKRGAIFIVPLGKRLSSYSRRILSISWKKKKILFFWNFIVPPCNFSIRFYHRVHGSMAMAGSRETRCLDWIVSKKWVTAKQGRPAAVRWDRLKRRETMMEIEQFN